MSINLGATISNPLTLTPAPESLTLTANNHAVTATENNATDVTATNPTLSLTSYNSQVNEDVIVQTTLESLTLTSFNNRVTYTPVQGNVTIDAETATLTLTANSVGAVSAGPSEADWTYRSTMPTTMLNVNFPDDASVTDWKYANAGGQQAAQLADVTFDTSDKVSGAGCLKIVHRQGGGSGSGAWSRWTNGQATVSPVPPNQSVGEIRYLQWQSKFPADRWFPTPERTGTSSKVAIWAGDLNSGTAQSAEISFYGQPKTDVFLSYARQGERPFWKSDFEGSGFVGQQTQIDRGLGLSDGIRYALKGSGQSFSQKAPPDGGYWNMTTDNWITFLARYVPKGSNLADIDIMGKRESEDHYTHIHGVYDHLWNDAQDFKAIHLLFQETESTSASPDSYQLYDEVLTSENFIPAPKRGGAPSWFTALTPNQWEALDGTNNKPNPGTFATAHAGFTTLQGPAAFFDVWNGATIDTDVGEWIMAANGGHGHRDNSVIGFHVRTETPVWRQLALPSDPADDNTNASGKYDDDTPASTHSYCNQTYCPMNGKIFLAGMGSLAWGSGQGAKLISAWSRTDWQTNHRGWDTFTYGNTNDITQGVAAFDPVTCQIIVVGAIDTELLDPRNYSGPHTNDDGGSITSGTRPRLRVASTAWSQADDKLGDGECAGHHGIFVTHKSSGGTGGSLYVFDTVNEVELFDGTISRPSMGNGASMMWHEASDAMLIYPGSGKDLYKLAPSDWGNPTTGWSYDLVTITGGDTPEVPYSQGDYGKCGIIPNMGNGEACLINIQKETSVPYVMRLTGGL